MKWQLIQPGSSGASMANVLSNGPLERPGMTRRARSNARAPAAQRRSVRPMRSKLSEQS